MYGAAQGGSAYCTCDVSACPACPASPFLSSPIDPLAPFPPPPSLPSPTVPIGRVLLSGRCLSEIFVSSASSCKHDRVQVHGEIQAGLFLSGPPTSGRFPLVVGFFGFGVILYLLSSHLCSLLIFDLFPFMETVSALKSFLSLHLTRCVFLRPINRLPLA
jgi:hypothetical protein